VFEKVERRGLAKDCGFFLQAALLFYTPYFSHHARQRKAANSGAENLTCGLVTVLYFSAATLTRETFSTPHI